MIMASALVIVANTLMTMVMHRSYGLSSTVTTGQCSFAFEPVDTDLGDNIISEPVVVM